MSDPNALPVAGWYPDPENEAHDRWWNGATWSEHRRPRNAAPGWAPAAASSSETTAAPADPAVPEVPKAPDVVASTPAVPVAAPGASAAPAPGAAVPYAAQQAPASAPYAPAYAPNYAPATPNRNPLALAGMVTSLIALAFNWILWGAPGITGAIMSFVALRKANQLIREGVIAGNGKAMAITGIVAGLAGAFLFNLFYFTVWAPFYFY